MSELERMVGERMGFLASAVMLREIRGWPNSPVHNAAIVYELRGWEFDQKDAALIAAERLAA